MNDGGPAFPTDISENHSILGTNDFYVGFGHHPGMSLRDWFAGMAMHGLTDTLKTDSGAAGLIEAADNAGLGAKEAIAKGCYNLADVMLKEREKDRT